MASAPSQYLLRWNDHLTNYGDIFLSLREQEEFVDCSIACEDGLVGAHRVVLAGCSPYLRDLFTRVSNPHPLIFLLNTPRSLVLMLMEFIYRGQVHIPQHRLQQLVVLGQALKIKGLTQIMIPVTNASADTTQSSSITSMAFPQGLPLTNSSSLPFTAAPSNITNNMGISILTCENEQQQQEEENIGEEEEREFEEDKFVRVASSRKPRKEAKRRMSKPRPLVRPPLQRLAKKVVAGKESDKLRPYSTIKGKIFLGSFAVEHGMDATKRYIFEQYNVKARNSTIEHLIIWYKRYQEKKKKKPKRMEERIKF